MVIVIYISSSNIICGDGYCFIICTQDWFIIFYPYDKEWFGFIRSYYKLKFENTTKRLDFLLKSTPQLLMKLNVINELLIWKNLLMCNTSMLPWLMSLRQLRLL